MPFDESVILEVAKQLAIVQHTPVNQNLARQLLELAASNKSDIDLFGALPLPPPSPQPPATDAFAGTMAKKLGTFPVTLLLAIHAKAIQSATLTASVKGFSKSNGDRLEGCDLLPGGGLSGGLQEGAASPVVGGLFKPEFRASALGLDKMVGLAALQQSLLVPPHVRLSPLASSSLPGRA